MRNRAFLLLITLSFFLLLLFGCSANIKKEVPGTDPFSAHEAEYIKQLYWQTSNSVGWLAKESPGMQAAKPAIVESLRKHPKEILPILISGWENGWKGYPWASSQPTPPIWLIRNNRNLLNLIICLDPKEAEKMLVEDFNPETFHENPRAPFRIDADSKMRVPNIDERKRILTVLYWQLHSSQWKPLMKPLALSGEGYFLQLYVGWCAQENDKEGAEFAETLLKKEGKENNGIAPEQYQSYACQLKGDVEGLKTLCKKYQNPEFGNSIIDAESSTCQYPLWSLMFMKRDNVVTDFANGKFSPEIKNVAGRVLRLGSKWRSIRSADPCEVPFVESPWQTLAWNSFRSDPIQ